MEEPLENNSEIKQRYIRALLFILLCSLCGLFFVTFATNPGSGGPVIILIFLLLTFISVLTFSVTIIQVLNRKLFHKPFSWLRLLYTAVAIAAGFVFLIGLQTLKQLQAIDVLLVILFEALLNFYLLRRF